MVSRSALRDKRLFYAVKCLTEARWRRIVAISGAIAAAATFVLAASGAIARATAGDARVGGTFVMRGVVTDTVNVRGERRGERVTRKWTIRALSCHGGSVCHRLLLTRNRGRVKGSFVVLRRVGPGNYRGSGTFWVALECLGRRYRLGSRAPYTITVHVVSRRRIGSVWYATTVRATYTNPSRSDNTRCPLGPASDAARYRGRLTSKLPKPPPRRPYPLRPPRAEVRVSPRS